VSLDVLLQLAFLVEFRRPREAPQNHAAGQLQAAPRQQALQGVAQGWAFQFTAFFYCSLPHKNAQAPPSPKA